MSLAVSIVHRPEVKRDDTLFLTTSLLILFLLSACSPASMPATAVPIQTISQEVQTSPAEALPASTLVPSPTAAPEEEGVYPAYLPHATRPDVAPITIKGVTAEIDWAYVDESRVALHYTLSGLDWPDGSTLDLTQHVQIGGPSLPISSFSGGSGGNSTYAVNGMLTASSDQLLMDGSLNAGSQPSIDLIVDIPVEGPTKVGTFRFEFKMPVVGDRKFENVNQTVIANHIPMTLKTLLLTPSRAEAVICFQMPSAVDWGLAASKISVGGRDYPFSGGGIVPGTEIEEYTLTDPERCNQVGFDIVYDESVDSITLAVPKLMGSVPEVVDQQRVDQANQRLAADGIQFQYVNVDHGGNFEILRRPDGKTEQEISALIWDALAEQFEGPWVFTVPIQ